MRSLDNKAMVKMHHQLCCAAVNVLAECISFENPVDAGDRGAPQAPVLVKCCAVVLLLGCVAVMLQ